MVYVNPKWDIGRAIKAVGDKNRLKVLNKDKMRISSTGKVLKPEDHAFTPISKMDSTPDYSWDLTKDRDDC